MSCLPQHATDAGINRPTGSTTVLDRQQTIGRTRELVRPKRNKAIVFTGALVFIAVIAGLVYYSYPHKRNAAINSIAVLPLQNASGDPNIEYLSDGLTESLIYNLSQLPSLRRLGLRYRCVLGLSPIRRRGPGAAAIRYRRHHDDRAFGDPPARWWFRRAGRDNGIGLGRG